jgi:ribonucleoside-triphosphate reductase
LVDATFRLPDSFVSKYKNITPPFGFNGLGEFVYLRTYSRIKADNTNEVWYETVRRVVEGTYRMQERHIREQDLGWSDARAQKSAKEMYDRMFNMKFLPPGRGMWAMGSPLTEERGLYAALNNCAFVSTEYIDKETTEPFTFLMDASMVGIGVGFDVKGAGKLSVGRPLEWFNKETAEPNPFVYVVTDDREGWVRSLELLLQSYFCEGYSVVTFDYSIIRPKDAPIKGFGGTASGPGPLIEMHDKIRAVLDKLIGQTITETAIVDIMNLIGCCVVAGNVRRTAEIVFGPYQSEEYLALKDYHWDAAQGKFVGPNAERAAHGWTSNNSIFCDLGMDYKRAAAMTHGNGEPGYMWLENAKAYGRMEEPANHKDKRVKGANPCVEQSLEHMELCNLVETFPSNCSDYADYRRTLKLAYLYAKTVTLGKTHWPKTNKVLLRNRRIGTSMSGVQQFVSVRGLAVLKDWCEKGYEAIQYYDRKYSEWFAVPMSVKTTSIKPSGTVSLLAGATPGMHWPESRFYIRRVRLSKSSPYAERFREANYVVEDCVGDDSSVVIEFYVALDGNIRTVSEVTIWEQFAMAAFLQRYWADNQVSCTVTFDPKLVAANEIAACLDHYQYQLKGISLLPKVAAGVYAQMPYEDIFYDEYLEKMDRLLPLNLTGLSEEAEPERGCTNDTCIVDFTGVSS